MTFQYDLCDGVANLYSKDFIPSHMKYEPLIHTDCAIWVMKYHPDGQKQPSNSILVPEDYKHKGDLIIWELWKKGQTAFATFLSLMLMPLTTSRGPQRSAFSWCIEIRRRITCRHVSMNATISHPFLALFGSLLGTEADATSKRIVSQIT